MKVSARKKFMVMLTTLVMAVTMIPNTIGIAYEGNADTEKTMPSGGDTRDMVLLSWEVKEKTDSSDQTEAEVTFEASYDPEKNGITSAQIGIKLDSDEASLLKQFRDKNGAVDEDITLTPDEGNDLTVKKDEDGGLIIFTDLDSEQPFVRAGLDFGATEGTDAESGVYDIAVDADDVTCSVVYGGSETPEALPAEYIALSADRFSITVAEEADVSDLSLNRPLQQRNLTSNDMVNNDDLADQLTVEINAKQESQSMNIFWVDNKDESGGRPGIGSETVIPVLSFSLADDGKYTELTAENMGQLGLSELPEITMSETGIGKWVVNIPELPNDVTHTDGYGDVTEYDNILWKVTPKTVSGYQLTEVTQENIESGDDEYANLQEAGWYYVLTEDLEFNLLFRKGDQALDKDKAMDVIKSNFHFNIEYREGDTEKIYPDEDEEFLKKYDVTAEIDDVSKSGVFTLRHVPKYNLDGTRITYSAEDNYDEDKVTVPGFDEGDYYSIRYDNTAVPGFTAQTDEIYSGGTAYLTLTGMRDYESAKIWLDDGESDTKAARPTGEFQLWRYRQGQSYTTAAPVRDSDGNIMTIDLENGTINEDIDPEFDSQKLEFDGLDKYDTEGYRYFYVLREYLDTTNEEGDEAQNYEQVFGGVNGYHDVVEDKEIVEEDPDDPLRAEGNRYLYNGGILLNRIDEDTTVSASKVWKAAAFQAAFEGVEIELTLYSRTVGETEWESTGEKRTMDEFSAEISVDDISATMPKYDEFGQEVEYIWLESAVYQNGEKVDFSNDENDPLKASFTLQQDGRQVEYASVSQIQSEEGDEHGDTVITNSIANTVTYTVDKEWYNADNERITPPEGTEVEFGIYRVINGEDITTDKRVAKITMDGEIDEDAAVVNEELGISVKEESAWHAVVDPLVEFDENGNQYEYVLLEMSGNTTYIPEYDISKDKDGNYHATVINKPGPGPRIMVRKNWNDNSDIAHREPVEITAYEKGTGDELGSIVLGGTNEDGTTGTWYDWLGLSKDVGEDNVYILETKVGETPVSGDKTDYDSWTGDAPTLDNGSNLDYSTIQYQAKNHMYEVSYSVEDVDGTRFYTAENRRLGNVNLTVTKEWTDGDGSMRNAIKSELENLKNEGHDIELAIQLRFHDAAKLNANYEDDYYIEDKDGKGYVSIGRKNIDVPILGNDSQTPVSSIQTVDFEDDQTMYFYNLPKYDADSDIVRYDVHEVWLEDGKQIDREYIEQNYGKLYELIADYDTRYADDGYTIVENHGSPDEQAIGVENYLTGTKDVRWKKAWHDAYNYDNSMRPDIYLDIYSRMHVESDGKLQEKTDVYQRDYKWTFDDEQQGQYSKEHYWFAQIENVPKYDALGYEINYYAIEKTIVDRESFDYTDVYYLAPDADVTQPDVTTEDYIGTEYEVDDAGKDYVIDVSGIEDGAAAGADASAGDTQPHYALIEEGTFNNHLDENVEVTAQKLWSSLPEGYEIKDLPTAEFTLYRQLAGEESADPTEKGEEIASITINGSDWVDILKNGSYQFNFVYEGENKYTLQDGVMHITGAEGAQPLSKYDEDGNMWRYTVVETDLDAGVTEPDAGEISTDMVSQVFHQANGGVNATIENTYESVKGSLSVKKLLYLPMVEQGGEWTPEAFPAVTFELWRTYTENDGTASAPEKVDSRTWTSEQVKDAYNSEAGNILDRLVSFFTGDPVGADEERIDADGNFEPLENIISFEDLDIYAPNGSKYVYSVREVKDNLNGYDTWVAGNDVEISGADSYIDGNEHVADGAVPETEGLDPVLNEEGGTAAEEVQATFINRETPERETVNISGKKIWDDFGNVFNDRPSGIELVLYRQADSQPGEGNDIARAEVDSGLYTIEWEGDDNKNAGEWLYTISGNNSETSGELEKYAPNGMPWKYSVEETALLYGTERVEIDSADNIYKVTPANGQTAAAGAAPGSADGVTVSLQSLKNSIATEVPFSKTWVDSSGNVIEDDLLGVELSVDFTLQVAESTEGADGAQQLAEWQDAAGYFAENLSQEQAGSGESVYESIFGSGADAYEFTKTVNGNINDDEVWGKDVRHLFTELPYFIKKLNSTGSEDMTELVYRVVESKISYVADGSEVSQSVSVTEDQGSSNYKLDFSGASVDGTGGSFTGLFSPAYPDGSSGWSSAGSYADTAGDFANMLKTQDMTAKKAWQGDADNAYGTRGDTGRSGYTWEVSFVVQSSTDGGRTWNNVNVTNDDGSTQPFTVTIYGTDEESAKEITIDGLPLTDLTGNEYQYRVREIDVDGSTVIDGTDNDKYNVSYDVVYDGNTVTNSMESTEIYANKIWNDGIKEENRANLVFELKYLDEDGKTWRSFDPAAKVTLDGRSELQDEMQDPGQEPSADPVKVYAEYDGWRAKWSNVPLVMPESSLDGDGHTIYTVEETDTGKYLIETSDKYVQYGGGLYYTLDIANNEMTSLTVEKSWFGVGPDEKKDVVAGIYRAAATEEGISEGHADIDSKAEPVPDADGKSMTVSLNESNNWKQTIRELPKYDGDGNTYVYFAKEISIGGEEPSAAENIYITHENGKSQAGDYSTRIINVGRTDIEGSKVWKDNGDAYGTRPDDIKLELYRTAAGETEEVLVTEDTLKEEGAEFSWVSRDGDTWSFRYAGLPRTDSDGSEYTYKVKEVYERSVGDGDEYKASYEQSAQEGYVITNTLTDMIDIPVTKIWSDNGDHDGNRPESITIALYANGEEIRTQTVEGGLLEGLLSGDEWECAFEGLPEYDEDGVRIEYTVAEKDVPDGYDVRVDGMTVENIGKGGLAVSKTVKGSAGDRDREFHFTVKLDDSRINGTFGEMEFVNGVAEFSLSDGETVTATGLPGRTGYAVHEEEADRNGYVTSSENANGDVPAGDIATVEYVNSKEGYIKTKTGDDFRAAPMIALMILAAAGAAGTVAYGRRRRG